MPEGAVIDFTKLTDELHEQGYSLVENFLPETTHQQLLLLAKKMAETGEFRQARIGRQLDALHDQSIRRDKIRWLHDTPEHEAIEAYYSAIHRLASTLNQAFYLGLAHFETHFAIYQPGDFYRRHVDQFINTRDRRLSCVYYLNNDWQTTWGGELKLYNAKNELLQTVVPSGNRFICFDSQLPHEVCVTHQPRYSLAGWLKTRSTVPA
ncbi:2OG-Fe(II) oxygenase [Legionella rubrilucens]|uniref:2OG-Fe(II) oxygenase n=1 Tax=Legionella rubrilucens TaxID=458 RepID=UPI000730B2F3|nr:2OG-Fe(II) oxygenase [Legionella rubrilucens]